MEHDFILLALPNPTYHADQIIGLLDGEVTEIPQWPPPSLRALVVVIIAPDFDITHVMRSEAEMDRFKYTKSSLTLTWLTVPVGRVLEQHPTVPVRELSPVTREKQDDQSSRAWRRNWSAA